MFIHRCIVYQSTSNEHFYKQFVHKEVTNFTLKKKENKRMKGKISFLQRHFCKIQHTYLTQT